MGVGVLASDVVLNAINTCATMPPAEEARIRPRLERALAFVRAAVREAYPDLTDRDRLDWLAMRRLPRRTREAVRLIEAVHRDREWLLDPDRCESYVNAGGVDWEAMVSHLRAEGLLPAEEKARAA